MNDGLKILAGFVRFLESEIRKQQNECVSPDSEKVLKRAVVQAIDLGISLELASSYAPKDFSKGEPHAS